MLTQQPPAQSTVVEGQSLVLSVAATSPGGSPLTYQWSRDGQAIAGATASSYTTAPMRFSLSPVTETYSVVVSNAVGSSTSQNAQLSSAGARSWQDRAVLNPGSTGDLVSTTVTDADGRTHIFSAETRSDGFNYLRLSAFSPNDANDSEWNCCSSGFRLGGSGVGTVASIRGAVAPDGSMMVVWEEAQTVPVAGESGKTVRAAVYQPHPTDRSLRGTWTRLDDVGDTVAESSSPAVTSLGAGTFEIAWLQRANATSPRSALARRYTMPTSGLPTAAGFTAVEPLENTNDAIAGPITLVGSGGAAWVSFYRNSSGSPRWQANHRPAGGAWNAAGIGDIAVASGFAKILHAVNNNGVALLATASTSLATQGRLYVRRLDVSTGVFLDPTWTYSANAYGSDPALLIDDTGRCDIFGVYVETNLGFTSQLMHWTRPAQGNWVGRGAVANSNTDFSAGDGLRNPVAGRDAAGNVVLGYTTRATGGVRSSWSRRYETAADAWGPVAQIVPPDSGVSGQDNLSLAVSPNGAATAVLGQTAAGVTLLHRARLR